MLGDKVTQTTAMDDKRIKKDLQETFGKLLDACVTFVGRTTEPSSWIKRTTKESLINGRSSPAPRGGEIHSTVKHLFIEAMFQLQIQK